MTLALFLTAVSDLDDRVEGLEASADDYLPKPFTISELEARVAALGRRGTTVPQPEVPTVTAGNIDLYFLM